MNANILYHQGRSQEFDQNGWPKKRRLWQQRDIFKEKKCNYLPEYSISNVTKVTTIIRAFAIVTLQTKTAVN